MPNDESNEPAPALNAQNSPTESGVVAEGRAAYNVVSDTVTGVNFRKRDNVFQAIFIVISVAILAAVGGIVSATNANWGVPWYAGALAGGFVGLVLGFLASGIFLMIYRGVKHLQGKHE